MIGFQLFIWVSFVLLGTVVTYFIFKADNKYVLTMSIILGFLVGVTTCYFWILMTNGLSAYDWRLFVLPPLIGVVSEILYLAKYMAYHSKKVFPKRIRLPIGTIQRLGMYFGAIGFVVALVTLTMSQLPSGDPAPAISTFGSTGVTATMADDIADTPYLTTSSADIMIQTSVISPTIFRNEPKLHEYLSFKIEFDPTFPYVDPSLDVFVQDENGELVPRNNIISYSLAGNTLEGTIYCDVEGIFTLMAVASDGGVTMESNSLSYEVQGLYPSMPEHTDSALTFVTIASIAIFGSLIVFGLVKAKLLKL